MSFKVPFMGHSNKHGQISVASTSIGVPENLISTNTDNISASMAYITCEDNDINYTVDGTTPTLQTTTNVGHILYKDNALQITGLDNIQKFRCINRVTGKQAVLKITTFKGPISY